MKISTALVALLVVVWISFQKASADDAPKRVIPRGAVVDVTGKPVRGARVQIRRWTGVMSEALERATTDEAGRFSFSERDDDVFYVTVQSPGLASVNLHVPDELPMTITLRPAVQSSLTIHDANGQPVAGATISSLSIRTPENPVVYLGRGMESRLDWEFRPSDANGRIEMPPLPVLKGQVVNESGQAAPGAIVRLREGAMSGLQPTVCDSQGRFEITLPWIPVDQKTSQRIETVKLTAHILNQPYSCISSINLTDRAGLGNLTITLKPDESPDSLLQLSDNAWSNGQRTKASEEAKQNYPAGQSGSLTPELDGGTWLNTDARRLADFRGKYVLLDFWFTGCGPCHADFPSVKLVHEAFADDVVVIAVHDNSSTADKVREHCESLGLKFPIVVDQPDGRVLNKWGSQVGVRWFPTYVLLDPDGRVLVNDAAYVGPSLRQYKLEVIREVVLRQRGTKKTSEASK